MVRWPPWWRSSRLGTNGGGFFGPNSTHPFENPTAWTNLLSSRYDRRAADGLIVMAGLMLKEKKHAAVIYGVMLGMMVTGAAVAIWAESKPSAATEKLAAVVQDANMEGKEARLGPVAAATWAAMTTATSNGSVNSMHDSLNPLAGMVPMSMMMLNVVFSGIGSGFENMLMYHHRRGLSRRLDGRPDAGIPGQEGRGPRGQARHDRDADPSLDHPGRHGPVRGHRLGREDGRPTRLSHGFSEILYEFTSSAANNGSGFEGLGDNTPAWNIACGIVLLLGRFPALVLPIALAGFLAAKKRVPRPSGTLRTDNLTFALMLLGTVLLVGALSFMPAVVLGPVADHLTKITP